MIPVIKIRSASENNLKDISLDIPHHRLVVVTGVSGSGKSSLVYDVIGREGQRLFLENFLEGHPLAGKKLRRPHARVSGLYPVLAVNQRSAFRSPRSTVGTLTELYDYLRLLFARLGKAPDGAARLDRSFFSFNTPSGQCPECKGLGVLDRIDTAKLVADPAKTLRQGALDLTTPKGYIIYSQVTMEVLDQVCRSEGFSADVPWKDLTDYQRGVVLHGSDKISIPFGKHPLESRMKWSGITARPRAEGRYRGIVPVMEEILARDRNPNILRFASSLTCPACGGKRLNPLALAVRLWGRGIAEYTAMSIKELLQAFEGLLPGPGEAEVVGPVRELVLRRCRLLQELGLRYLTLDRCSDTLSGGEAQRIKLANLAASGLRNVLYVLDEPSAGLHPADHAKLLGVVRGLVEGGNSVIAVEHDEQTIRSADWIIDLGPGPGEAGGELLFSGPYREFLEADLPGSSTWAWMRGKENTEHGRRPVDGEPRFSLPRATKNNLKGFSAEFVAGRFNVVTGVSGAGKSSLVEELLETAVEKKLHGTEVFKRAIHVDQSPIGRNPNSNPATYTGMSDHIRDLFAGLPESRKRGYAKGRFSFAVKGGRCEACQGAGVQEVGMHFLGNVEVICEACGGRRFSDETLEISHKGKNIAQILEMSVDEAHGFFDGHKKIKAITGMLRNLGLGYLRLGQPSTTLSGGEAQRVKLATHLSKSAAGRTLYVLDEPTTGLHLTDVSVLVNALRGLTDRGDTVLAVEHHPDFILSADWVLDLGPGSGDEGGSLVYAGPAEGLAGCPGSVTGLELSSRKDAVFGREKRNDQPAVPAEETAFTGVTTNNLKSVDLKVPLGMITAVTGVSGSGKSSLAFDTLHAEGQRRFNEGLSTAIRQMMGKAGDARFEKAWGLAPSIAVRRHRASASPRTTVGTYTGIYDLLRLLYSRAGEHPKGKERMPASAFSFNNKEGACEKCRGIGAITACDPELLVTDPRRPLTAGAMDGTKTGRFYGEPDGQYVATLRAAGRALGIDFDIPWTRLDKAARRVAMWGLPAKELSVEWEYRRGKRTGVHRFAGEWKGFANLVDMEYARKHADRRGEAMLELMSQKPCPACGGRRLAPHALEVKVSGIDIAAMAALPALRMLRFLEEALLGDRRFTEAAMAEVLRSIGEEAVSRLRPMIDVGLGYIPLDRRLATLSGGEFQRLNLASQLRSGLCGITYVLDEPSFGLHPADAKRMAGIVAGLRDNGNTVVVVEQSPAMLTSADRVLELGPGAGQEGGSIVFQGTPEGLEIFRGQAGKAPPRAREMSPGVKITGARANNLMNVSVEIPSGGLVAVTGVSGSGKTSLIADVLWESRRHGRPVQCETIRWAGGIEEAVMVEQDLPPQPRTAIPGTFLGVFDHIRELYAGSDGAKERGFGAGHFSFLSSDGRCRECQGAGAIPVAMDFWADAEVECPGCHGRRYRPEVLDVRVGGLSIADALATPLEALRDFAAVRLEGGAGARTLKALDLAIRAGVGYLPMGQPLSTLSTGEMQRLKLAAGLSRSSSVRCLYILDEPTGGLHAKDIERLLLLFDRLVGAGGTVLCVTHEPRVLRRADWQIELGPGAGDEGGKVVRSGPPEGREESE